MKLKEHYVNSLAFQLHLPFIIINPSNAISTDEIAQKLEKEIVNRNVAAEVSSVQVEIQRGLFNKNLHNDGILINNPQHSYEDVLVLLARGASESVISIMLASPTTLWDHVSHFFGDYITKRFATCHNEWNELFWYLTIVNAFLHFADKNFDICDIAK